MRWLDGESRNLALNQSFSRAGEVCLPGTAEPHEMTETENADDALLESARVQGIASSEGFDWDDVAGVLAKVDEEVQEIRDALQAENTAHARKELGDLLLVVVNLARFLEANPREELRAATRRFANRYDFLKKALALEGLSIQNCTVEQLEQRWQQVKHRADEALRTGA